MGMNFEKDASGNMGVRANINPFDYPTVECHKCHNKTFRQVSILKEIPGIAVGAGAEHVNVPLTVYACDKCGEILLDDQELLKIGEDAAKEEQPKSSLIL